MRWERRRFPVAGAGTVVAVVAAVVVVFPSVQLLRGTPGPAVEPLVPARATQPGTLGLPWPAQGAAAVAVKGQGLMGTSGSTQPVPVASITKVMTALVVLADHPLAPGQQGPGITISAADAAAQKQEATQQLSTTAVSAGEQLTEYQALEALLIPSADNIADVLAAWDAGSMSAFVAKMNGRAHAMGLRDTTFADASGLDPASRSTPADLVALGAAATDDPVLEQIVALPEVSLPVAGVQYNYDFLVGHNGIVGMKTGSDSAAGGCFLADLRGVVGGAPVDVLVAVVGQRGASPIAAALSAGAALAKAGLAALTPMTLVRSGETVGVVRTAWGASAPVVAERTVQVLGWPGMPLTRRLRTGTLPDGIGAGAPVGTITVQGGAGAVGVPLRLGRSLPGPSLGWRLSRL
jgi:D-alanyl-D-alanine carboxypeptidase (penicillin-binding protein 5/6)